MASIVRNKKSGSRRIQYVDAGKRVSIPLGKTTDKQAKRFKTHLEDLLAARFSVMDDVTARWVAELPDDMHGKLVELGLVKPREATKTSLLGETIEWYINPLGGSKAVHGPCMEPGTTEPA
ncbi:hypothetical protein ACFL6U_18405 [Planctomycetota bacterium]